MRDRDRENRPTESFDHLPWTHKESDLKKVAHYIPTPEEWDIIDDLPRFTMDELFNRPDTNDMLQYFVGLADDPKFDLFVLETPIGDVLVDTRGYNYARYMLLIKRGRVK